MKRSAYSIPSGASGSPEIITIGTSGFSFFIAAANSVPVVFCKKWSLMTKSTADERRSSIAVAESVATSTVYPALSSTSFRILRAV